jgi:hypothetical protein
MYKKEEKKGMNMGAREEAEEDAVHVKKIRLTL